MTDLSQLSDEQLAVYRDMLAQKQSPGGEPPPGPAMPVPAGLQPTEENFWTSPGGLIRSGARQAIGGAEHMAQPGAPAKYSGASDIIKGVGSMAAPAAIGATLPALVASPAATVAGGVLGAAGGLGVGQGARALTKVAGGSPEAQEFAETGGSAAGGLLGGYGGTKLGAAAVRADPRVAMGRGLGPKLNTEQIPRTLSLIKAANPGFKPDVSEGQLNLVPAANRTIGALQQSLEPWLQRAEGQTFSGQPVVAATEREVGNFLPSEREAGQRYVQNARQDYGEMSPQAMRDRLTELNTRLSPFFKKTEANQNSALTHIPDAVLKAQRDALADTLYRGLDPENEGAGPRYIQSLTGPAIELRNAAAERSGAIRNQQPLTPLGRVLSPLKSLLPPLTRSFAVPGELNTEMSTGRSLPYLKRAFSAVPETEGANELGMLPRPGPRMLAAATDISGPAPAAVRDLRAATSPLAPKLLPAATSQIGVSGTTVPDIIGTSSRGTGSPQALLPPPKPGEPPINLLPTGPGAIGPAGTVPELSTETPIPLRGVRGGKLLNFLPRRY